ncbi:MAG: hypothetical protein PGN26_01550 [Xylophilus ampelinus]
MDILDIVLILTAKGFVWLVTFGRWRGESLLTNEASVHSAAGSLSFVLNGKRVITSAGLTLIGMALYGMLIFILFLPLFF